MTLVMEIPTQTVAIEKETIELVLGLIGNIFTIILSGLIAFFVASYKTKFEINKERTNRKLDIAYKYAELETKNPMAAELFLESVTKNTAIGFLFLNDNNTRKKIWIRNDSNILFGRNDYCDVVLSDNYISREHCIIHAQDNNAFLIPLNPTRTIMVGYRRIKRKYRLKNGDKIRLHSDSPHHYIYFQF